MAAAEARDRVRALEDQLAEARQVLHRTAEEYVTWTEQAEVATATASRSVPHDLLGEAKRVAAEVKVERMLTAVGSRGPGSRPFASRGSVTRSESCQWCIDQNVSDEQSYLLHSDPELNAPVTTPQQAAEWQASYAARRHGTYTEVSR